MAMTMEVGMPAKDAISAVRLARSPEIPQTVEQFRTLVELERLWEAELEQATREPIYVNTAFQGDEA
jgi:hypothetical protein